MQRMNVEMNVEMNALGTSTRLHATASMIWMIKIHVKYIPIVLELLTTR
jgi:hypothetical protein